MALRHDEGQVRTVQPHCQQPWAREHARGAIQARDGRIGDDDVRHLLLLSVGQEAVAQVLGELAVFDPCLGAAELGGLGPAEGAIADPFGGLVVAARAQVKNLAE